MKCHHSLVRSFPWTMFAHGFERLQKARGLESERSHSLCTGVFNQQGCRTRHRRFARMSRRGNCWDNAVAEAFFSSLKKERIKKQIYRTRKEARADVFDYIEVFYLGLGDFLLPSRLSASPHLSTRQYARIVASWVELISLDPSTYGTHSLRRTKVSLIYRRTKNLRAVQLLLGHASTDDPVPRNRGRRGLEVEGMMGKNDSKPTSLHYHLPAVIPPYHATEGLTLDRNVRSLPHQPRGCRSRDLPAVLRNAVWSPRILPRRQEHSGSWSGGEGCSGFREDRESRQGRRNQPLRIPTEEP
jgi:hypothetical protein